MQPQQIMRLKPTRLTPLVSTYRSVSENCPGPVYDGRMSTRRDSHTHRIKPRAMFQESKRTGCMISRDSSGAEQGGSTNYNYHS